MNCDIVRLRPSDQRWKNILVRWGDIGESWTGEEFNELVLAREDAAVEQVMYFPQLLALVYVEPAMFVSTFVHRQGSGLRTYTRLVPSF